MPPSASEILPFDRLHPKIQAWIREQQWEELRDIQARTVEAVLASDDDVLISAATAAGKTEAAFLPALTAVAQRTRKGASILYVGPLKALINDQFRRLDLLCERMEIDVVRWHGDAPQSAKQRALRNPRGVVLITPESIEAMLLRRPSQAKALLGSLDFIIIDELHAFLQGPRGLQLASLLNRIDALDAVRARRIGLSATIGDPERACSWLRPGEPERVRLLQSSGDSPELRLQIRGLVRSPNEDGIDDLENPEEPVALDAIADHAFGVLRGSNNLVFGGSRRTVEAFADRLRSRAEAGNVPNEFFPHHGSLSKALREDLELRLKDGKLPTTAVATTTLELGIDIGSVKSVAQLGAPRSIGSLRQRLGRSGRRRGAPAILRVYVREDYPLPDMHPLAALRPHVVQATAAIRLMLEKFVEPPPADPALLTVALQQTLSIIVQDGARRADGLYRRLAGAAPFRQLTPSRYGELLRSMAAAELLEQSSDGLVMLGPEGERLTNSRDFYAVFETDQEWRLVASGRVLGTLPISNIVAVGMLLVFAGRRWRVTAVDSRAYVLEVVPHRAGKLPKFSNASVEPLHDRMLEMIRSVYEDDSEPAYLDQAALTLLAEGRRAYRVSGLSRTPFIERGSSVLIFTWRGSALTSLLGVLLLSAGLECLVYDLAVHVSEASAADVVAVLGSLKSPPKLEELAGFVMNLERAKYDEFVGEYLLRSQWIDAHSHLEEELWSLICGIRDSHLAVGRDPASTGR